MPMYRRPIIWLLMLLRWILLQLYPADESSNWPHLRFGAVDLNTINPYKDLHQGYKDRRRYSAVARAEYIHNLSALSERIGVTGFCFHEPDGILYQCLQDGTLSVCVWPIMSFETGIASITWH